MTDRLYQQDAYARSFTAHILDSRRAGSQWEVALDRTCFYPTGGGQPADKGTLGGQPVLDVREEEGRVWHVLAELPPQAAVQGEIDWSRRFDHMQQHTGQHILSQVFLQQESAQTLSFHLGTDLVTIDLDVANLSPSDVEAVEVEANRLVMEDVPVRAYFVSPEQLATLDLRRPPTKGERTRIVEIVGFDLSPCGGTHVRSTGQIGLIKVRRTERYKGGTRVEFLCGWRALHDYQWKHQAISSLARELSVADRELQAAVLRLIASEKDAWHEIETLRKQALASEALTLHQTGEPLGPWRLIAQVFPDRPAAEVKQLATLLAARPATVALLATGGPSPRLFFARSTDVDLDMCEALRSVTKEFGGGGGGRPEIAEGGGMPPDRIEAAVEWASRRIRLGT